MINNLKLRWKDKSGKEYSRIYTDKREAEKAKKWLLDNHAVEVDIAVVFEPKHIEEETKVELK